MVEEEEEEGEIYIKREKKMRKKSSKPPLIVHPRSTTARIGAALYHNGNPCHNLDLTQAPRCAFLVAEF
jgi:hypothetical protein